MRNECIFKGSIPGVRSFLYPSGSLYWLKAVYLGWLEESGFSTSSIKNQSGFVHTEEILVDKNLMK